VIFTFLHLTLTKRTKRKEKINVLQVGQWRLKKKKKKKWCKTLFGGERRLLVERETEGDSEGT
jgi:Ran GTPase-activating protein (RanGAP) involved in mRNA processing and transport